MARIQSPLKAFRVLAQSLMSAISCLAFSSSCTGNFSNSSFACTQTELPSPALCSEDLNVRVFVELPHIWVADQVV